MTEMLFNQFQGGHLNPYYFKTPEMESYRKECINDTLFVDFIKNINIPSCFDDSQYNEIMVTINHSEFVKAVSQSASEVAQQIVADRASKREQMINESDSNLEGVNVKEKGDGNVDKDVGNVDKDVGNMDKDVGDKEKGDGNVDKDVGDKEKKGNQKNTKFEDVKNSIVSKDPTSVTELFGGRKTRRRKRTRRPKKQNNKKTQKRRR